MAHKTGLFIALAGLLVCGCSQKGGLEMWENAKVVATRTPVNGQDVITLDPALLKDTIVFPISHFMDEMQIVKLDDRDEALIYSSQVLISDNYILVKSGRPHVTSMEAYHAAVPVPCKLFTKDGKYISDIGAIGQGPGEYTLIYSMQLNEKNGQVYLMPWNTDKILVYDLAGNMLEPIPLPTRVPKAVFKVDGDKIAIAITPFPNNPSVAWVQTSTGEVISEVPAGHFTVTDFSNEVTSLQNTADMDISFWNWPARADSLYHLDTQSGKLIPQLTMDFKNEEPKNHSYVDWGDYYVGNTQAPVVISRGNDRRTEGDDPAFYILDKQTLKGAYLQIKNDYLDNKSIEWPSAIFYNGYYSMNMEPAALREWIDNILKSEVKHENMRQKLTALQNSITDNDNNYIIYSKMK